MTVALAKVEPVVVLTKDDIRKYICPNADDKEIFMFLGICKSFGLNPMKREVHLIKYGNSPASIVTGYEVYLKRAERTGKLDGWGVEVSKDGESATVTINRKDWSKPFTWTAYRKEFDKQQANWRTMPMFMLRKVAMAQAFRICFPDEMGGLPYLPEEISGNVSESLPQHEPQTVEAVVDPAVNPPPAVEKQPPPPAGTHTSPLLHPDAPPLPEKKDMHTLINELHQLAEIARDAGLYPTEGAAIYEWTKWEKDGKTFGYKNVASIKKEWQASTAIEKAQAQLNTKPSSLDEPRDDDIPSL